MRGTSRKRKLAAFGTACDRGHEHHTVAFPQSTGFSAEEADVFLIQINIEELADLPAVVADVTREPWKPLGQRVQRFRNGRGTTVHFRGALGEAPKSGGNFNCNWHESKLLDSINFQSSVFHLPQRGPVIAETRALHVYRETVIPRPAVCCSGICSFLNFADISVKTSAGLLRPLSQPWSQSACPDKLQTPLAAARWPRSPETPQRSRQSFSNHSQ